MCVKRVHWLHGPFSDNTYEDVALYAYRLLDLEKPLIKYRAEEIIYT